MTPYKLFPHLESSRLRLREITNGDTEPLFDILSNQEAMRNYGSRALYDLEEASDTIDWYRYQFSENIGIRFGITLKPHNQLIGTCGLHTLEVRHRRVDLVCVLHPDYWRQGIMSEALQLLIDYSFDEMQINRLQATVETQNNASHALFRSLGFREEGVLRDYHDDEGQKTDMTMFALLRRDVR